MTTDNKDFEKPLEPEPLNEADAASSSDLPGLDLGFSDSTPMEPMNPIEAGTSSGPMDGYGTEPPASALDGFPDSPFPETPADAPPEPSLAPPPSIGLDLGQSDSSALPTLDLDRPPEAATAFSQMPTAPEVSVPSAPTPPPYKGPVISTGTSTEPSPGTLDLLREFAEQTPVGKPVVQAEFPFSLSIEGRLTAEEKEKLVDLIKRENMGIMESDLEPQLAAGRILIPRISEYAGVLLVQALRAVNAEVKLGPSDSIFSTEDTRSPETHPELLSRGQSDVFVAESTAAADRIVVTNLPFLPEFPHFTVIETLTASGALSSSSVEAETSPEYQELMEGLQKELKHRAFHKGAVAIINLQVHLVQLGAPTSYRLSVTGSAIRGAPKPVI